LPVASSQLPVRWDRYFLKNPDAILNLQLASLQPETNWQLTTVFVELTESFL
jgi:hypothetical protein